MEKRTDVPVGYRFWFLDPCVDHLLKRGCPPDEIREHVEKLLAAAAMVVEPSQGIMAEVEGADVRPAVKAVTTYTRAGDEHGDMPIKGANDQ